MPPGVSPLLVQHDPARAEEISRTAYVGNVAATVEESDLRTLFETCGPIVAIKVAGDATQPTRFAFVEFASQESVPKAIALTGYSLNDRTLKVSPSKNAINKGPQGPPRAPGTKREARRDDRSESDQNQSNRRRRRSGSRRRDDRRRSRSRSRSRETRRRSPDRDRRDRDRDRERRR